MKKSARFFITSMPIIMAACSVLFIGESVNAATRAARASISRTSVANTTTASNTATANETSTESVTPKENIINKSSQFSDVVIETGAASAAADTSFADAIARQRAALKASEEKSAFSATQRGALASNSNSCDTALRKCMMDKCGEDFTKCATDGDTIFGDKLNKCKTDTTCTGEEFALFSAEIKADRDMNVKLASYNSVINCGNKYNSCIQTECGETFNKCLGKTAADAAIKKCETIAKDCKEYDSGLTSRVNVAIAKLREGAEVQVKSDEKRLTSLRDLMRSQCQKMGAAFDERSFDCVFTVNFYAGTTTSGPTASRKAYAGDSFICMQEFFGVNATTFKENAYRETRSQTAASSAMLGSGVGMAAGLVTSGALDRAISTQKAKKDLKKECEAQGGKLKNGECVSDSVSKRNDVSTNNDENAQKAAKYDAMQNQLNQKAEEQQKQAQEEQKQSNEAVHNELNQKANDYLAKQEADGYDMDNIPDPVHEEIEEDPE